MRATGIVDHPKTTSGRAGGDGQVLVDQRDDGCAFADRAAYALYRARAHVADREHARHVRLERRGQAARRSACARADR
mgnify:CR=1 FL=1